MNNQPKKFLATALSLLYLSSALFLELGHTDIIEGDFGTIQKFFSHDCTGTEMHRPLGKDDQCPVCARISHTTAYVQSDYIASQLTFQIVHVFPRCEFHSRAERSVSLVRGPPTQLV